MHCLAVAFRRWNAFKIEWHGRIFQGRQGRQQVVRLKNKADISLPEIGNIALRQVLNRNFAELNRAASWFFKAGQHVQESRFPRT